MVLDRRLRASYLCIRRQLGRVQIIDYERATAAFGWGNVEHIAWFCAPGIFLMSRRPGTFSVMLRAAVPFLVLRLFSFQDGLEPRVHVGLHRVRLSRPGELRANVVVDGCVLRVVAAGHGERLSVNAVSGAISLPLP